MAFSPTDHNGRHATISACAEHVEDVLFCAFPPAVNLTQCLPKWPSSAQAVTRLGPSAALNKLKKTGKPGECLEKEEGAGGHRAPCGLWGGEGALTACGRNGSVVTQNLRTNPYASTRLHPVPGRQSSAVRAAQMRRRRRHLELWGELGAQCSFFVLDNPAQIVNGNLAQKQNILLACLRRRFALPRLDVWHTGPCAWRLPLATLPSSD